MQPVLKASFGGSAEDGRPSPPSAPEDSPVVSAAVGLHAVNVTHGQLMRTFVSGPNGDGMLADPGTAEAPPRGPWTRQRDFAGRRGECTSAELSMWVKLLPSSTSGCMFGSRWLLALSDRPFSFAPHPEAILSPALFLRE